MPMEELTAEERKQRKQEREVQTATVVRQVIRAVGMPAGLKRLNARRLWKNHFRVNVFVGADGLSATVGSSYFVVTDDAGNILESAPPIASPQPAAMPIVLRTEPLVKDTMPQPEVCPSEGQALKDVN